MVALPLIAATVLTVLNLAAAQRGAQRESMLAQTRALAAAVDSEINRHLAVAYALSNSGSLREPDLARFHATASATVGSLPGVALVLVDSDGQQLVNTRFPAGTSLPRVLNPDLHARVRATGRPQVPGLVRGPLVQRLLLGVIVPVYRDQQAVYTIIITLDPGLFLRLLQDQKLDPDQLAGIIDQNGLLIARTQDNEGRLGTLASEGWRIVAARGGEGIFESVSLEGEPFQSAYKTSQYGWSVSIGQTSASLYAPLRDTLFAVALYSTAFLTVALALAIWVGRSIANPVKSLEGVAAALTAGKQVPTPRTRLAEIDRTMDAFDVAAAAILERDQRQRLLARELDHRVKNTLAVVQSLALLTARATDSPSKFVETFQGRLAAVASGHDLLTRTSWTSAALSEVIQGEVKVYGLAAGRVFADGPHVDLPSAGVLPLAMSLHELFTNAAKYGALSVAQGRIDIRWTTSSRQDDRRWLQLTWRETGGPAVAPPAKRGLGMRLIEETLRHQLIGAATFKFHADGLMCDIAFPLVD